jgi:hypothetical protein
MFWEFYSEVQHQMFERIDIFLSFFYLVQHMNIYNGKFPIGMFSLIVEWSKFSEFNFIPYLFHSSFFP